MSPYAAQKQNGKKEKVETSLNTLLSTAKRNSASKRVLMMLNGKCRTQSLQLLFLT